MRGRITAREDPFSGEARPRLGRIARDLDAVVTDAQSRDWVADRADRVVFARLGQVRHHVRTAAGRRRGLPRITDPAAVLVAITVGITVTAVSWWFLVPRAPFRDPGPGAEAIPLALTTVVGLWAGLIAVAVLKRLRRRWDRLDPGGYAPIDDPYRYAAFRRRIEAGAALARGHRSYRRRATTVDLEHALDWLSAAQTELPRR